ncbi:flagellar hook capping FlgD N-terminal domain-containing protein [Leptolinea tardivitalis]|uniref:flagellar hook capping FlgD N-terminal domain-containing protein n=1 Tax=Leptolinea tardivitalis TaxID=229920 RepID=UPI00078540EF|nr:flagellar hook capping FlgD N-terminal domain-containing protein [Leptolinea tardivitalis]GAP22530.1 flagellar hook capping protein [Leptolinea tardivitalis]
MIKVGDRNYTGAASETSSSSKSTTSTQNTSADFMSLLLAQLTNQNPLEPMDDTEMVSQMVSMNSLEELQKITKAIQTMSQTNQFASAATLMDKTVTYLNDDEEPVSGKVSGITMANSEVYLTVGGTSVKLSDIVKVTSSSTDNSTVKETDATETEA